MQNFTANLNHDELKRIHHLLKRHEIIKPNNPYLLYFYRVDDVTISIFKSHKLLIQGPHAKSFYEQLTNQKINELTKSINLVPSNSISFDNYIGCDEVGVGDYFGGLVTCAVYLKKNNEQWLRKIGICDSKHLTDQQIKQMFIALQPVCDYEFTLVSPDEYNQLVKRFQNTHIVKSYLHDLTIKKLTAKLKLGTAMPVVMDQFASQHTYYSYFQKIGVAPYEITKFETNAENKYLAVAAASIIARIKFLEQIATLSEHAQMKLLLGASNPKIITQAQLIYAKGGMTELSKFAKIDFATTKKVIA
ncbi:MAG: ribonuclease HIII [Mycoplasmataceae bacterium]|nr:ribonuclease HIII [Mycoplasmataceae bacterium]